MGSKIWTEKNKQTNKRQLWCLKDWSFSKEDQTHILPGFVIFGGAENPSMHHTTFVVLLYSVAELVLGIKWKESERNKILKGDIKHLCLLFCGSSLSVCILSRPLRDADGKVALPTNT